MHFSTLSLTLMQDKSVAPRVQRVLIVDTRSLLVAGIKRVLSQEASLNVVTIAPDNEISLIDAIRCSDPDAIVLDEGSHMIEVTALLTLLEEFPELRVVVLRVDDSVAHVYDKRRVLLRRVADLVTTIRRS